jgi:hypothetical protein
MNLLVGPGRAALGSACDGNARHAVMFRGAFWRDGSNRRAQERERAAARAAAKAMRAEAPTLSFSKRDVSSVWPDNIHKVSVLGDHFD